MSSITAASPAGATAGKDAERIRRGLRRYLSIKSAHSPEFSPDDSRVAYLSDITGVPQVWMTSLDGSEGAQQLTMEEERVGFISYAPRSERIAFSMDSGGNERFQLYLLEGGGDSVTKLQDEPEVIHDWGDWSPDERRIVFSSNGRDRSFFDVYVQSLDDLSVELLYQSDESNHPRTWSPDGRAVLFEKMHAPFNHDLLLARPGEREAELLTPHEGDAVFYGAAFDAEGRHVYCVTDQGREFSALARIDLATHRLEYLHAEDWDVEGLSLSPDKRRLAFTVNEGGYSRLMVWELGKGERGPRPVATPGGLVGGLDWSNDGRTLACSFSSSSTNSDIWLLDFAHAPRRLTTSSTCGIPRSSFVELKPVTTPSFDGIEISSFLYEPRKGAASGKGYPLIVYLHGGPESQFRPGFSPTLQYFLKMGFGVLATNFRGSTGYGRTFTHLDDIRGRMDTVKDAHIALRHVLENHQVDPRRVAAWGGSYGGFMVLACLYSEPDSWAAGVDIVGISNFVTFLKNTGPWRRRLRIAEYGDPEKDGEFLEAISPNNNARLIRAPLFIIHGANDPRVPLGEAEQIAETLKRLGREAHLMKFEDEGHGLVKLGNRITAYSDALEFLLRHLS